MTNNLRCWIRCSIPSRWLAVTVLAFFLAAAWTTPPAQANKLETANVMAPLHMRDEDHQKFQERLLVARRMGVNAVAVDVWWGLVAKNSSNPLEWDWSYYDSIFKDIKEANKDNINKPPLHIVPVMSFHQCGPCPECYIPIPPWIWEEYQKTGKNKGDLMYMSEQYHENGETVAPWADEFLIDNKNVIGHYKQFMEKFQEQYLAKWIDVIIDEISISTGTQGELRYPSYDGHDTGSGCPNWGFFQSYSAPSIADFRSWALKKYGGLEGVNKAWCKEYDSEDKIGPPDTGLPDTGQAGQPGRAYTFVYKDEFRNTLYGRDFIDWYNDALIKHGRRMLEAAHESFGGAFATIPLGIKIPGVHWQMASNASHPRIAEIAAGLIRTSVDYSKDDSGHGYNATMAMIHEFQNVSGRPVNLYLTALERDNCEEMQTCWQDASQAKALVSWVAQAAKANQVTIKGENALAVGVTNDHDWDNIEKAFKDSSYCGLTVLRIENVTDNPTGKRRYQNFINSNRSGQ